MNNKRFKANTTLACLLALAWAAPAFAQVPPNPASYSRTQSFTYDTKGNLVSSTVEPSSPDLCLTTTTSYSAQGMVETMSKSSCAGASTTAQFPTRTASVAFAADPSRTITVNGVAVQVAVPAGIETSTMTNGLGQTVVVRTDPRFSKAVQTTDPNGLSSTSTLDDFGRTVRSQLVDGTSDVSFHCTLAGLGRSTAADTPNCPVPSAGEAPSVAAYFIHVEPRNTADVKMKAFTRTYFDIYGRKVRAVTETFDAATQPSASGALAVVDTVYNAIGQKVMETAPYFLATGASTTSAAANAKQIRLFEYDELGRKTAVYETNPQSAGSRTKEFGNAASGYGHGQYGTLRASKLSVEYSGLSVTDVSDVGQRRTKEMNAIKQVVRVTDAAGAQVAHQYNAFGQPLRTRDALQNTIDVIHDIRGRRVSAVDPDKGQMLAVFNAIDDVVSKQSARQIAAGTTTQSSYDVLGRLVSLVEPEMTSSFYYDRNADGSSCGTGVGKLCETVTSTGVRKRLNYDAFGRLASKRTDITGGPSMAQSAGFDSTTGQLSTVTYPTGVRVGYGYTARGYLETLTLQTAATVNPLPQTVGGTPDPSVNIAAGTVLWRMQKATAAAMSEQELVHTGIVSNQTFDPLTSRVVAQSAGIGSSTSVLERSYSWDSLGNLTGRVDGNGTGDGNDVSETFAYGGNADVTKNINRLVGYTVAGPSVPGLSRSVSMYYNALGMLLSKTDVGNYAYAASGAGAVRPHAVQSVSGLTTSSYGYDAGGNVTSSTGSAYSALSHASFEMPLTATGSDGVTSMAWGYDEAHARVRLTRTVSGAGASAGTRTTWYQHPNNAGALGFEYEVNSPTTPSAGNPAVSSARHFLSAGGKSVGVLVSTGNLPTLASNQLAPTALASVTFVKEEFWHLDHLGSIVSTTDQRGDVTARYAYDPFGKRRFSSGAYDANNQVVVDWSPAVEAGTARGFTGHEHLDSLGIVHMNGRLFDPKLGLFMQADPYIQDSKNLESYNRYAYTSNNPLNATDPTGYLMGFTTVWANCQVYICADYTTTVNRGSGHELPDWFSSEYGAPPTPSAITNSNLLASLTPSSPTYVTIGDQTWEITARWFDVGSILPNVEIIGRRVAMPDIEPMSNPMGDIYFNHGGRGGAGLGNDFIRGFHNDLDMSRGGTQSLGAYQAGMAARTVLEVGLSVPQDMAQASGFDYLAMAMNAVPLAGKALGKAVKASELAVGTVLDKTKHYFSSDTLFLGLYDKVTEGYVKTAREWYGLEFRDIYEGPLFQSRFAKQYFGKGVDIFEASILHHMDEFRGSLAFDLSGMDNIPGILAGVGRYANNVTSAELRLIRDNWSRWSERTTFMRDGAIVEIPW